MTTVEDITERIEQFAPKHLAEDWDPIGLAFGSSQQEVKRMLVALDLDQNTLKEAKEKNVDFIFTHHPSIFSSLDTLNGHDARRREYLELIRANIALYSAHTNVDAADDGMNDWLAEALNLEKPYEVIDTAYQSELKLLVLYSPLNEAQDLRQSLHKIGAGNVGDYHNVSYTQTGKGHFTPGEAADPAIGDNNKSEVVSEERIEMLFPKHLLHKVIQTVYQKHPYEEPVFHILDVGKKDKTYGIGRVGSLKEPQLFSEVIDKVKEALDIPAVRVPNVSADKMIEKVAVLGGSGADYYKQALARNANVYVTGDISYHQAQDMIRDGLLFIDAGHFIEQIFVEKMTGKLKAWKKAENWSIDIIPAQSQIDVFNFK